MIQTGCSSRIIYLQFFHINSHVIYTRIYVQYPIHLFLKIFILFTSGDTTGRRSSQSTLLKNFILLFLFNLMRVIQHEKDGAHSRGGRGAPVRRVRSISTSTAMYTTFGTPMAGAVQRIEIEPDARIQAMDLSLRPR